MQLILKTISYPMFKSPKLLMIDHSKTPKNGLTLPSKLLEQNMEAPTNLPTALPGTSASITRTQSLLHARPKIAVCKPLSATAFSAMLSASQVSGIGEHEIKKHLKAHLGTGFCPTRQSVSMLSKGHGVMNYSSIEFTYEGNQQKEFVEWTKKFIDEEIARYLQHHLQSKSANQSDVQRVQVVVGGSHRDTAFQFEVSVSVRLSDGNIIHFKVLACKLICRKDTGKLHEVMILPKLTSGLSVVAISPLHIYKDDQGIISCKTGPATSKNTQYVVTTIPKVNLYVTGNLAFQAMVTGKESMLGHWYTCTEEYYF
jgi:hypothetical protein